MSYPYTRPRRMRRDEFSRRLMREHVLTANDLIYPVFVHEAQGRAPVGSMPGVERLSIDELLRVGEQALELGVPVLDLFGVPDPAAKTADGRIAMTRRSPIIRDLPSRAPTCTTLALPSCGTAPNQPGRICPDAATPPSTTRDTSTTENHPRSITTAIWCH